MVLVLTETLWMHTCVVYPVIVCFPYSSDRFNIQRVYIAVVAVQNDYSICGYFLNGLHVLYIHIYIYIEYRKHVK